MPEFYVWFADFLTAEPGTAASSERGRRGHRGHRHRSDASAWSADDADQAAWLYHKLAPQARELFDLLLDAPGERYGGEMIARQLGLEKGAHGVAGILAWPGRYCAPRPRPTDRHRRPTRRGHQLLHRPRHAAIFAAAREQPDGRNGATNPRRRLTGPPPFSNPRKPAHRGRETAFSNRTAVRAYLRRTTRTPLPIRAPDSSRNPRLSPAIVYILALGRRLTTPSATTMDLSGRCS